MTVTQPYNVPAGVQRGRVLGDPILMVCATVIVALLICATVALSVTNHSADVKTYVGILTPTLSILVGILGLGKRTGDVHAQSTATYLRLNGELDARIATAVQSALNAYAVANPAPGTPTVTPGV